MIDILGQKSFLRMYVKFHQEFEPDLFSITYSHQTYLNFFVILLWNGRLFVFVSMV